MGGNASTARAARVTPASSCRIIRDSYESIEEVQDALRSAGLESSQLIVGMDFTKSNEWTGRRTFAGRCLHDSSVTVNPYMEALTIVARTLASFDDDNLIPCYGFGDLTSRATKVFSFFPDDRPANGLEGAVARYLQICPHVQLCGPTSFAPLIKQACRIVIDSGLEYHILVIIADGQVTPSCLQDTKDAIVVASSLPLSIVMVGVGDGPWDDMEKFDDGLPTRRFDNFQFVDFAKVMTQASVYGGDYSKKEAHFAVHALMEIPEQFKEVQRLGLMDSKKLQLAIDKSQQLLLPPPLTVLAADASAMQHTTSALGLQI